jgi:hypothetical protein
MGTYEIKDSSENNQLAKEISFLYAIEDWLMDNNNDRLIQSNTIRDDDLEDLSTTTIVANENIGGIIEYYYYNFFESKSNGEILVYESLSQFKMVLEDGKVDVTLYQNNSGAISLRTNYDGVNSFFKGDKKKEHINLMINVLKKLGFTLNFISPSLNTNKGWNESFITCLNSGNYIKKGNKGVYEIDEDEYQKFKETFENEMKRKGKE